MTICDIYHDKTLLADWLGILPEGQTHFEHHCYGARINRHRPETADEFKERVARAWKDYTLKTNPHKEQTHANFIRECIREVYGLKCRGNVEALKARIVAEHPDVYGVSEQANAA